MVANLSNGDGDNGHRIYRNSNPCNGYQYAAMEYAAGGNQEAGEDHQKEFDHDEPQSVQAVVFTDNVEQRGFVLLAHVANLAPALAPWSPLSVLAVGGVLDLAPKNLGDCVPVDEYNLVACHRASKCPGG